jgi:hypothetical protein
MAFYVWNLAVSQQSVSEMYLDGDKNQMKASERCFCLTFSLLATFVV